MAAGTQPTTTTKDTRRIAEDDPDYQRLQASTRRKLRASVQQLVRDLKTSPQTEHPAVQSRFIQRHVGILKDAYIRAHQEGQRDYWQQVSQHPNKHIGPANQQRMRRVLGFYAPSVAKMAHEAQVAWQAAQARTIKVKGHETIIRRDVIIGSDHYSEAHTGVMVAFPLATTAAKRLALPGGESPAELHITLAYLGDKSALTLMQQETLSREVASYAAEAIPLAGEVSGMGRFTPSPSSEGKAPVVALVNVPGLHAWRAGLVKRLDAAGLPVAKTFEYQPHITLAYVADGAPMPVKRLPAVKLQLDQVTVAIGDEQQTFPVGDEQYPANGGNKTTYAEKNCRLDDKNVRLDDTSDAGDMDPLDWFFSNLDPRISLQADLTWPALNDGYTDGPLLDPANPYYYLYWDLDDGVHQHCGDCPDYAAGSPYTPPGSGVNELDATPGDGHTACGAACKCSLRYGMGSAADRGMLTWNQAWKFWRANPDTLHTLPPAVAAAIQGMPEPPVALPSRDDLSDEQKAALDDYRDAMVGWDQVRGDLPPLPGLFADTNWTPPDWESLTQAQQDALVEAVMAQITWGHATDEAIADWLENLDMEFREESRETLKLYNHNHDGKGRFTWGSGPGGAGGGHSGEHARPMNDAEFHQAMQHRVDSGQQSLHGGGEWIQHGGKLYIVKDTGKAGGTEKDATEKAIEGSRRLPGKAWQRELAANEIGEQVGLGEHQPQEWHYDRGGRAYAVSERIPGDGRDLMKELGDYVPGGGAQRWEHEQEVRDYLHSQPRDTLEKMALHEYVTQNGDPHAGNLMRNGDNQHLMAIDREMSFGPSVLYNPISTIVNLGLTDHIGDSWEGVHLSHASIRAFTKRTNEIIGVADKYGFPLDHLTVRMSVLHHLDTIADPTLGDLKRLSIQAYKGQLT